MHSHNHQTFGKYLCVTLITRKSFSHARIIAICYICIQLRTFTWLSPSNWHHRYNGNGKWIFLQHQQMKNHATFAVLFMSLCLCNTCKLWMSRVKSTMNHNVRKHLTSDHCPVTTLPMEVVLSGRWGTLDPSLRDGDTQLIIYLVDLRVPLCELLNQATCLIMPVS